MKVFEKLLKTNFLANVAQDLRRANQALKQADILIYKEATHYANREATKDLYYEVCEQYGFFDLLYEVDPTKKLIHYIQSDQFIFVCSRSLDTLKDSIHYSLNVNGDIPVYQTKHSINKKVIHTLLIDTTFTIPPPSYN